MLISSIPVSLLLSCGVGPQLVAWRGLSSLHVQDSHRVVITSNNAPLLACSMNKEDQLGVLRELYASGSGGFEGSSVVLSSDGLEVGGVKFDCDELVGDLCAEMEQMDKQQLQHTQEIDGHDHVAVAPAMAESRRLDSKSKADKNIFYCDGDQFELFDDGEEDGKVAGVFAWCKMMVVEASLALHALQWRGKRGQTPSTAEIVVVAIAVTWQAVLLAWPIVRYALLFQDGMDYLCHTLGMFSFKTLWLMLTFLMTTSQAWWLWQQRRGYIASYAFAVAITGTIAITLAAGAGSPVLLLTLAVDAILCIVYLPMTFWLTIQVMPAVLVIAGLSGLIGNIAKRNNWLVLVPGHDSRGDGTFAAKILHVLVLLFTFPTVVWCLYGYVAVDKVYSSMPNVILMRVVEWDPVVVEDLKLTSAMDLVTPHMMSVILSRLLVESAGLFSAIPRKIPPPAVAVEVTDDMGV